MSMAFEITREDVHAALNRMGVECKLDSPEVEAAWLKAEAQDARITKAALYGDDLDQQTEYALDEIQAILNES